MPNKYHRDIRLPLYVKNMPAITARIYHTIHATEKVNYFKLPHPGSLSFSGSDVVECELDDAGNITKLLIRLPLSSKKDICYVLIPKDYIVATVYPINYDDNHPNLEKWRYEK